MYQLGWFSTGRGDGSKGLLKAAQDSISSGELNANIEFVFCSRERGETEATNRYLDMVTDYGIPLVSLSYQRYKSMRGMPKPNPLEPLPSWRLDYDREVMKLLGDFQPDLCVLAGFMLIVGPEVCRKYNMINLHPAAPGGPVGMWQQVIWQLIDNEARETGVLMFLVTPEMDKGPPVTYCTFPIRGKSFDRYWNEIERHSLSEVKKRESENNPLFKLIRQHGLAREFPLIISTLKAFSQGKIKITAGKKVVDSEGRSINGYNLTDEINELVEGVR